jgi:hypothetical protein
MAVTASWSAASLGVGDGVVMMVCLGWTVGVQSSSYSSYDWFQSVRWVSVGRSQLTQWMDDRCNV